MALVWAPLTERLLSPPKSAVHVGTRLPCKAEELFGVSLELKLWAPLLLVPGLPRL